MTYKEVLFFIGKCLTISHEEKNLKIVSQQIISNKIDWDIVVKVSTSHYVFPALYCNLKRTDLLQYLPEDLVLYMKHITDLNRERNLQIIEQIKEVNELLIRNNITPIFIKGTGFLLEGLYEDIAERMTGDIDFLVSKKDFNKAIKLLENNLYQSVIKINTTFKNRHYPRIVHPDKIAGIEVHYRMVIGKLEKHFNYKSVQYRKLSINNINILSLPDQILMTCVNKQINDLGQWYKNISLRSSYDLFLLSKKESIIESLKEFHHYFSIFNNFLASTENIFNHPASLEYEKNQKSKKFLEKQLSFIENQKKYKKNEIFWHFFFLQKSRFIKIFMAFYNKEARRYLLKDRWHFKSNS